MSLSRGIRIAIFQLNFITRSETVLSKVFLTVIPAAVLLLAAGLALKPHFYRMFGPPDAVIASAAKVLRVHSYPQAAAYAFDTTDLKEARTYTREMRAAGMANEAKQIEFCARGATTSCPIYPALMNGSGFLLSDKFLLTNYHLIHQAVVSALATMNRDLSEEELPAVLSRIKLPVKVFSAQGREILRAGDKPAPVIRAQEISSNPDLLLSGDEVFATDLEAQLADLVRLAIPAGTWPALKLADRAACEGDAVFLAGFPDSPNRFGDLRISSGHVLSPDLLKTQMGLEEPSADTRLRRQHMIFADFACAEGESGGPILNTHGEVVGMLSGYYENTQTHQRICYGINLIKI